MADQLRWVRADMQPAAECDAQGCDWYARGSFLTTSRDITEAAKRHARQQPGHFVIVDRITRTSYVVPTAETAVPDA